MSVLVELWTDGSGTVRGKPGGFAFILRAVDTETGEVIKQRVECGRVPDTTNNRMELGAVLGGLATLKHPTTVKVFSDSEYVVKGFTEGRVERWERNDWTIKKKGQGRVPVANRDMWEHLLALVRKHDVTFEHVEGHAGIALNERCDKLAGEQRRLALADLAR